MSRARGAALSLSLCTWLGVAPCLCGGLSVRGDSDSTSGHDRAVFRRHLGLTAGYGDPPSITLRPPGPLVGRMGAALRAL